MTAADQVAAWARGRSPRAGRTRVLAVEGRSGAGKSDLATAVADRLGAELLRLDDLYPGWDGLLAGVTAAHDWVLEPLSRDAPARWRRWDWATGRYAEWHPVGDRDWLVVDGVGSGARQLAPYLSGVVWVDAPTALRRARALARDGDTYAPHWSRWAAQEDAYYAADDVRGRADLVVDTSPGRVVDTSPGSIIGTSCEGSIIGTSSERASA
ncbi:dephospho-CoA kinase [Micromonospora haikouensis]|uniref:dephospho-CoA kinase n=1 Tax=Micromonospora TaxID=1873 RepID=UPI001E4400BC|nr:dephospho-CoA kinase [Micromonospora sp. NBRC 110038]